jgi:uncharacterized membrane protein YraQ (UPF0718 family)
MSHDLRWRIIILQAIVGVVLAFVAGVAYWASDFTHSYVHDQLAAQKISFPAKGSAALDPKEFPDLQQYAGQALDSGPKAKAYANGFIGRHLEKVSGGQTYSQVSAQAQANPSDQKLAGQVETLFKGETLRSILLNAWGWWTVGSYALYAAVGLTLAAAGVALALLFELVIAPRRETVTAGRGGQSPRGRVVPGL